MDKAPNASMLKEKSDRYKRNKIYSISAFLYSSSSIRKLALIPVAIFSC